LNRLWTSMFGSAGRPARKVVYLHNSMKEERDARFPRLECCFRNYTLFDAVLSVSEKSCELNIRNLAKPFRLEPEKFGYCDNVHDPERVLRLADAPIAESDEQIFGSGPVFLTMGRLSVEKDHAKLISAFASLRTTLPHAKLV